MRVEGGAKLGVVHLEFTDLVVPDFGIPIAVNRIYDSRDADVVGDFGYGWTLDIRQGTIQHNYPVGRGIAVFTNTGDFTPCTRFTDQLGHYAEVRLSDDEWYIFRPIIPDQGTLSGGCGGHVAYEMVDGIRPGAELRIAGNAAVRATAIPVIGISGFAPDSNLISTEDDSLFDPQDFELLLPDGRRFGLNAVRGITWIAPPNDGWSRHSERMERSACPHGRSETGTASKARPTEIRSQSCGSAALGWRSAINPITNR